MMYLSKFKYLLDITINKDDFKCLELRMAKNSSSGFI